MIRFAPANLAALTIIPILGLVAPTLHAVSLDKATTLRTVPTSCGDFVLNTPATVTAFATTEAAVTLAFSISGGRAGDVAAVTYITPAGQVYTPASGPWEPLTAAEAAMAHVCFYDQGLRIAGYQPATMTGTWSVKISVNNVVLTTLTFTIGSGGASCSYSLSSTSGTTAAAAGGGTVNVIAGAGCPWTAASNAQTWLTIGSGASGNGNGAINWSVTANGGTASRTGTIMVYGGAQTLAFTLTQYGNVAPVPGTAAVTFNAAAAAFNDDTITRIIGWDFTPTTSVTVTALGFWSSTAPIGGLTVNHDVVLYRDSDQSTIVPRTTVPAGCAPEGPFCYVAVTPVTLAAGTKYVIVGTWPAATNDGFTGSPTWSSGSKTFGVSSISADSHITLGQGRFTAPAAGLAFPAFSDTRVFFGPSFKLTAAGGGTPGGVFTEIDLSSYANDDTRGFNGSPQYPTGENTFLAVPFNIPNTSRGFNTWHGTGIGTSTLTLPVAVNGATSVYFLLNTIWGVPGNPADPSTSKASITFSGSAGASAVKNLFGGVDIRDYYSGAYTNTINGTTTQNAWAVGAHRIDMVRVDLPAAFAGQTLSSITLTDNGGDNYQRLLLKAITVSTAAGATPCTYTLSPSSASPSAGAGNGSFSVATQTGCSWTASSTATSWLTVASGSPGNGNGTVGYSVTANSATASRTGTITVADKVFTVTQSGAAACSYILSPDSTSLSAAAGTGSFQVLASSGCSWTARPSDSWISIVSGSPGSGNGVVNFSVTAASAARTGSIAVGDKIFTISQSGPAPANCTFTLSATGRLSLPGDGFNTAIFVTTQAGCRWTATTDSPDWIKITRGQSGTGNGEVDFAADANPMISARTGTLTIADTTVTIVQAAGKPASGTPAVSGVANAASQVSSLLPAGGIAQGSIFSIAGTNLGPGDAADPKTGVSASAMPLGTTLANVSVQVKQGSTTLPAYPTFAWAGRVDAIMPSRVAPGNVTITITYNGKTSLGMAARVVSTNFGAYSVTGKSGGRGMVMVPRSGGDPALQNSNTMAAAPGQTVTLIGTGLGAIATADNVAPPTDEMPLVIQVLVGGKATPGMHASRVAGQPGKDQIQFQIPADAPLDCHVPVQVLTSDTIYSNIVTMAIAADGQPCASLNPWSDMAEKGGKIANVMLIRFKGATTAKPGVPSQPVLMEIGEASFTNTPAGQAPLLDLLASIPALGTCGALGGTIKSSSLNLSSTSKLALLDAGPALTLTGPAGSAQLEPGKNDDGSSAAPGLYVQTLGGGLSASDMKPPFLEPGSYTLTGVGGKDVGSFTANLTIPQAPTWTNQNDITAVDRAAGLTFTWNGGSDTQFIMLAGGGEAPDNSATGFICYVSAGLGTFTVPPSALMNLPASGEGKAGLLFGLVPAGAQYQFKAPGLDSGLLFYGLFQMKTVDVR